MTCTRLTRFALALSMLAAGTASAETYGLLDISSSTGFFDTINVAGIDVTEDGVLFSHQVADDDFTVAANYLGEPSNGVLGGSLQVANASANDIEFVIGFVMPLDDFEPGFVNWAASVTAALTGIDGTVRSLAGEPIWAASVGGTLLGTMLLDPFELTTTGLGTTAAEEWLSGSLDWNGGDTMTIRYAFSLSAGDSVVFGGARGFVPAPGAVALLGLAVITGHRRRRRTTGSAA